MGLWLEDGLHSCARCKTEKLQKDRGCPETGGHPPGVVYQVGEEMITHCLAPLITAESLAWLNDYGYIEAGILPEAGGLNDQYEIDLQAFAIIGGEKAAIEGRKRK